MPFEKPPLQFFIGSPVVQVWTGSGTPMSYTYTQTTEWTSPLTPQLTNVGSNHPNVELLRYVVHLNDSLRWSFSQIAQYLTTQPLYQEKIDAFV